MIAFPVGLENGYASRLLRRFQALRTLTLERMGPDPSRGDALSAVGATQAVAAGAMAPQASSFLGTAKALEVSVTREVSRLLKVPAESVSWQGPQVAALLSQWAQTQVQLVAKLERDVLADVAQRLTEAEDGADLRQLVTERFAAYEGRARFIARNEIGNLQADLVRLRAQAMGANRYRWVSRDDARVRPLHAARHGKVFSWDAPPEDGHPGEPVGCRCVADPVRDVALPKVAAKVTPSLPVPAPPPPVRSPKAAPKPITLSVPELPTPTPFPALPGFVPSALPAFPSGGVLGLPPVPVLGPPLPAPVLPALQIPTFPPPKPRPAPTTVQALLERTYRVFNTRKGVEEYGARLAVEREDLTREERGALYEYTGFHYKPVNDALRAGKTHRFVDALDRAIDKAVIPEDIQVHRGIKFHPALADMRLVKVGEVFTDEGYQSTTLDRYGSFGGGVKLHISVPAGSRALWVDDVSSNQGEYELLLPRNARLQITAIEWAGGDWHVSCLLLPP